MSLGFRRVCVSAGLAVMALSASLAHADEPAKAGTSVITRPDWLEKPTGDDMERFYPKRAMDEGVSGRATIACRVTKAGLLADCKATAEAPADYGFGAAAVSLAAMFKLKPKTVDGKPVGDGTIVIPIVFQVPESSGPHGMKFGDGTIIAEKIDPAQPPPKPGAIVFRCGPDQCVGHPLSWTTRPDEVQTAAILARSGQDDGLTLARCTVAEDGRLNACAYDGVVTLAATTAARDALALMTAAPTTADGAPTAGATIQIPFQWDWLAAGLGPKS